MLKLFCKNCQCTESEPKSIKDILREIISKQDIEKFITAAIIMGIQKFVSKHPETEQTLDNITNTIQKAGKKS